MLEKKSNQHKNGAVDKSTLSSKDITLSSMDSALMNREIDPESSGEILREIDMIENFQESSLEEKQAEIFKIEEMEPKDVSNKKSNNQSMDNYFDESFKNEKSENQTSDMQPLSLNLKFIIT